MRTPGAVVAQNVAEIRTGRGMSLRELAGRLDQLGRRMLVSTISKIENAERKVNAEDLIALALALDVSPVRLLLPGVDDGQPVQLTPQVAAPWRATWRWAVGEQPVLWDEPGRPQVADPRVVAFIRENRPFEDKSSVREAARGLVAREPVPFTAHIEADDSGRVKARLSWASGDEEDADGRG